MNQLLIKVFWIALFLIAVAVLLAVIAIRNADPVGEPRPLEREAGRLVVPEDRVPGDYQAALEAAPLEVLPHTLPSERAQGMATPQQQKELARAAEQFLREWETFKPYQPNYPDRLRRHVVPGYLDEIAARRESEPKNQLCWQDEMCLVGSRWVGGGRLEVEIERLEDGRAWITTFGAVQARPVAPDTDPGPGYLQRSYALMLRQADGKWLVERIVAQTIEDQWGVPPEDQPGH